LKKKNKIIFGTAFFTDNYTFNKSIESKKKNLLKYCIKKKIFHYDTAPSYGYAEQNLGKIKNKKIIIDTKLSKIKSGLSPQKREKHLMLSFLKSMKKLNLKQVNTLYVHSFIDFIKNKEIYVKFLKKLKKIKVIKHIGFSIYNSNELRLLLKIIKPDILQVPFNLLNQEFNVKKIFDLKKKYKLKLYARSIFLRGHLLLSKKYLIKKKIFKDNKDLFKEYFSLLDKNNISKLEACLIFAFNSKFDRIILGIENKKQLSSILKVLTNLKKNRKKFKFSKILKESKIDLRNY